MLLTLIRHSKTDQDPETPITLWQLSPEGIERAQNLSQNEDMANIEVIYSSLQTKALETTLILAKPNKIPVRTDDRLTEVTSVTIKFEPDYDKYMQELTDFHNGVVDRLNGGETLQEALERMNKAIEEIVAANQYKKNIGIVSHGNVLGLFISQYTDLTPHEAQKRLKMPDYALFDWDTKTFVKPFSDFR